MRQAPTVANIVEAAEAAMAALERYAALCNARQNKTGRPLVEYDQACFLIGALHSTADIAVTDLGGVDDLAYDTGIRMIEEFGEDVGEWN